MWVDVILSVEGLNRTKRLTLLNKRKFLLPDCFQAETCHPTPFILTLKPRLFFSLYPDAFQKRKNLWPSWLSGLQTWTGTTPLSLLGLQILDPVTLYNCMTQFLHAPINTHTHTHTRAHAHAHTHTHPLPLSVFL
jgi:hypothetical protein